MVGAVIGAAIGVLLFGAIMVSLARSAARRTPAGVIAQLPTPGAEYSVRLTWLTSITGTWNPAKPLGIGNPLCTLGRGTYRRTDDEHVELTWTASTGTSHTYRGTIPDGVRRDSPRRRRARHVLHVVLAVYAVVTVVGFAVGVLFSDGAVDARVGFGMLGVFVGWVITWLAILVMNVARGTAALRRNA